MKQMMPNQAEKHIKLQVEYLAKGSYLLVISTTTGTRKVIQALKL